MRFIMASALLWLQLVPETTAAAVSYTSVVLVEEMNRLQNQHKLATIQRNREMNQQVQGGAKEVVATAQHISGKNHDETSKEQMSQIQKTIEEYYEKGKHKQQQKGQQKGQLQRQWTQRRPQQQPVLLQNANNAQALPASNALTKAQHETANLHLRLGNTGKDDAAKHHPSQPSHTPNLSGEQARAGETDAEKAFYVGGQTKWIKEWQERQRQKEMRKAQALQMPSWQQLELRPYIWFLVLAAVGVVRVHWLHQLHKILLAQREDPKLPALTRHKSRWKKREYLLLLLTFAICCRFLLHIRYQFPQLTQFHGEELVQNAPVKETILETGAFGKDKWHGSDEAIRKMEQASFGNWSVGQDELAHNSDNKTKVEESEEKNKPLLVLHIGPHKTGTTTLQHQLVELRSNIFKSHNIVFLGKCYQHWIAYRMRQTGVLPHFFDPEVIRRLVDVCLPNHSQSSPCNEHKDWKSFFGYIQKLEPLMQNKNTSFLLSEENLVLGDVDAMSLFAAKLRQWFRVRVVITYRDFFEWIRSWYFENYRCWSCTDYSNGFPPSFVDYWRYYGNQATNLKILLAAWKEQVHPVTHLYNGWKPLVDEVVVFDTLSQHYLGKDTLTSFLDTAFPELVFDEDWKGKQPREKAATTNPSLSFDEVRLTIDAAKEGLLNQKWIKQPKSLATAVSSFRKHFTRMGLNELDTLPQECLNMTELHDLFELSEYIGSNVPGRSDLDRNRSAFRFQQAIDKQKFCSLDTRRMLEIEKLRKIFQSL